MPPISKTALQRAAKALDRYPFDPEAGARDPMNQVFMARVSDVAYLPLGDAETVMKAAGFRTFAPLDADDTQGFVTSRDDAVVVAFRGTEKNVADWWRNLKTNFHPTVAPWWTPGNPTSVHRGFEEGLDAVWGDLVAAVEAQRGPGKALWVTGHSLGGALATLAAAWLSCDKGWTPSAVLTFGAPRCGNATFRASYDYLLGRRTLRFVNHRDIVTRVPLRAMRFRHVGRCMYIDASGALDTDPSAWQRFLDSFTLERKTWNSLPESRLKDRLDDHALLEYIRHLDALARAKTVTD